MSVSVLILTLNEEANLPQCLDSVSWSDDIVVFDSFSSDRTVEIAKAAGARVVQRKFDNWSAHQNWAVENIEFKYPWVFYLDADERCDETLVEELRTIGAKADEYSAYQVRRKDFFMGRWLRRAQLYPTWITRIFRPEKIKYERLVNPVAIVDGQVGRLSGHLIHYPFSHGIRHWYDRHNNYSDMEALELVKKTKEKATVWDIFRNSTDRRRVLKRIAYRLPYRPVLIYLYLMLVRRAFLDGMPGIHYAGMRAT
jgi:glycosyltransferase involved in cell wall biosynthesis